jgi:hypothetical protein
VAVFSFIRRFLPHVLPQSLVKVRYFGRFAVGNRHRLILARDLLAADRCSVPTPATASTPLMTLLQPVQPACPPWGQPMLCVQILQPKARSPPLPHCPSTHPTRFSRWRLAPPSLAHLPYRFDRPQHRTQASLWASTKRIPQIHLAFWRSHAYNSSDCHRAQPQARMTHSL